MNFVVKKKFITYGTILSLFSFFIYKIAISEISSPKKITKKRKKVEISAAKKYAKSTFQKHLGKTSKLRTFGITHFFDNFILSRTLKLKKKNYQFEKSSETDFRIRLVESQNHGMKQIFFVKNQ